MTLWFSSDLHLDHANIIRFCNRPFADVPEMNEKLIEYHNSLVQPNDHWYCLGDVSIARGGRLVQDRFIKLVKRFNGHKRLLLGNHDHLPTKTYVEAGFEKIYATWRGIDNILLSHYPIHPRSMGSAKANVHGHTHNNEKPYEPVVTIGSDGKVVYKPYVNLSIEVIDYKPVSLDQVNDMINRAKGEYDGFSVGPEVKLTT